MWGKRKRRVSKRRLGKSREISNRRKMEKVLSGMMLNWSGD
jgi:hypothetical protein